MRNQVSKDKVRGIDRYTVGRRPVIAGIAATLFSAPTFGRPAEERGIVEIVDEAARKFLKEAPQSPGVSIGVFRGKEERFANFGSIYNDHTSRPTSKTIYGIASISKTFTGVLLAQASVKGLVSPEDDVRKYLRGQFPNLEYDGKPIRLWQLLNHNSGLPFNLPDIPENRLPFPPISPEVQKRLDRYTRADFLSDLHSVKLTKPPGEGFSYSNAGAVLLSYIMEDVFRAPFDTLIRVRIAHPLGMDDTGIALSKNQLKRFAAGYDENGKIAPPIDDGLLGAAAIKSTTSDLLKYARWHALEKDPAVRLTHTPHPINDWYSVGFNWQMITSNGQRRIWQEGSLPGYSSQCVFLPERHVGFVGLCNENDRDSSHAFTELTRHVLLSLAPGSPDLR
jgi:CubicO group peptidase (beta-lactamase class C family)